jgi:hypothetical protein
VDLVSEATGRRDVGRSGAPLSIVELVRAGTLDANLAALTWLLIEARVPVIVAAAAGRVGKSTLLAALLEFLPVGTRRQVLAGAREDFTWLREASTLGWRPDDTGRARAPIVHLDAAPADPATTFLVAPELSNHLPGYTWGEHARIAVRAISRDYGLGATIHADSLEEVFGQLGGPGVGLTDDELSRLGLVLVLRHLDAGRRVVAAHYVRPVSRDGAGHVQRLGPAVLAAWDDRRHELDDFAWGVIPELALRVDRRAGDFELELEHRSAYLQGLVDRGMTGFDAVRSALADYRGLTASATTS